MNTAAIVFLILTISFILIPFIASLCTRESIWMAISLASFVWFMLFCFAQWPNPTDDDVREGKAIYVTEQNIGVNQNGDTIYNYNTYKLEWLPSWEFGRKH